MNRNIIKGLIAVGVLAAAGSASAAVDPIDITAVTDGLSAAKTALLSVIGAFLGLSASILGVAMVQRYMKRKSGA